MTTQAEITELKKQAAFKAVQLVEDGMIVGLGTGSTAAFAVEALAQRVSSGLKILAIPTSEETAEQARSLGITLSDFSKHQQIDLTIDGADEVEKGTLNLIKGLGGALLREKLVAVVSRKLIIVVDETKLVDRLGSHSPVPVEVVQFGWQTTFERLKKIGATPKRRSIPNGHAFVTDGGNYILDCAFGQIANAPQLADQLSLIVGVVESGLFITMANLVIAATSKGIELFTRKQPQ
jgi:ribose 5-phosphate isomerase A